MPPRKVAKQKSLPANTTEQEDLTTTRQTVVNLLWENTQSKIALYVIMVGMAVNSAVVILMILLWRDITVVQVALVSLSLQFINLTTGIVIGFYFSRTNHTAIGGIGPKPDGKYIGR